MPPSPVRFVSLISLKTLVCPICKCIVDQPVETGCSHLLCAQCFCSFLDVMRSMPSCPVCSTEFKEKSSIHAPSPVVQEILKELQIHCDNFQHGCPAVLTLGQLRDHVNECHQPYTRIRSPVEAVALQPATESAMLPPVLSTPPHSSVPATATLTPSKISAILSQPITTPLSGSEKRAMTHLVKCAINVDGEVPTAHSIALECPTGGQVKIIVKHVNVHICTFTEIYLTSIVATLFCPSG